MLTLLMTDVEGSTRLWAERAAEMPAALARHDELVGETISAHAGSLDPTRAEGDSLFAVFSDPCRAVLAAEALQRALLAGPWPDDVALKVRVGVHAEPSGDADLAALRAGRVRDLAHGGQVLLSSDTAAQVDGRLPPDRGLASIGQHRLSGHTLPEHVLALRAPGLPSTFPPPRGADHVVLHNLPVAMRAMVGRTAERTDLAARLAGHRLVTSTGIGGVGKSRLAIAVAQDAAAAHRDEDGVWMLEVSPIGGLAALERSVRVAMGVTPRVEAANGGLAELLAGRRMLLVLDGAEHDPDSVAALIRALPDGIRVLATSRRPLGLPGEVVVELGPLAVPPPDVSPTLDELHDWAATSLLVVRGREANPRWTPLASQVGDLVEIARALGGHPLALELAASRLRVLAPAQIRARLADPLRLLAGGSRSAPARLRSLSACFAHDGSTGMPPWVSALQRGGAA